MGFYIKDYQVNFYSKLGVSLNALKCKYIIQDYRGHRMNHEKKWIRDVNYIISIAPFIDEIIEHYHI